jgi:hypothetical protein
VQGFLQATGRGQEQGIRGPNAFGLRLQSERFAEVDFGLHPLPGVVEEKKPERALARAAARVESRPALRRFDRWRLAGGPRHGIERALAVQRVREDRMRARIRGIQADGVLQLVDRSASVALTHQRFGSLARGQRT